MSPSRFVSFFVLYLFLHLQQGKSQIAPSGNVNGEILGNGGFKLPKVSTHEVPALYVIGDSFTDSGNNNFLGTQSKANFLPYGIDFDGKATGRFSNGKTTPDFIAETLGLPLPPPYMGLSESEKNNIVTGVNYASGSCGILPGTGAMVGTCLSLDKQIDLFENTTKNLKGQFKSSEDFDHYLSKSLFFIDLGTNDFTLNYILPQSNLKKQYSTPQAYGEFLSQELEKRLQRLCSLGARKLLVTNVVPLGDFPSIRNIPTNKFRPSISVFADYLNALVSNYNTKVSAMLTRLQAALPETKLVHGDVHKFFKDLQGNPTKFGLTDAKNSCCIHTERAACAKDTPTCKDRNQYVFFDEIHPTEATNFLLASRCFNETSICSPINLSQLILD